MPVDEESYATERAPESAFDYSAGLKLLVGQVEAVVTAIDAHTVETARLADAAERSAQVHEDLYARLINERQGVYIDSVELSGSLTRAMTVNALNMSDQFQAVLDEMANPTPIPGYGPE